MNLSKYSIGTFENRFGNFTNFRKHVIDYGLKNGIMLPKIELKEIDEGICNQHLLNNKLNDKPILGEKINFRGLVHAPVNELGVVYLFGMISEELGFEV